MVAHDLRNPLQGIANATFYLRRSPTMGDKEKEMLTIIQEDVRYSDKIVSDLLDYSKNIRLELAETNPQLLVGETLSMMEVPENIHVQNETEVTPLLRLDVDKMKRVFINIVNNAIDAMPDGGSLRIWARETDHNVDFVFADSGAGMTTRGLWTEIFTPLFTTKAKGMGLGLSICKRIVEAHGGKISAESAQGKGTVFTISLPLSAKSHQGRKILNSRKNSILVVDDDRSIRTTLVAILKQDGYDVDTAENGAQAIEKSDDKFFDLALIDVRLPDMMGTDLVNRMKERTPKMVKIIVTGYPSMQERVSPRSTKEWTGTWSSPWVQRSFWIRSKSTFSSVRKRPSTVNKKWPISSRTAGKGARHKGPQGRRRSVNVTQAGVPRHGLERHLRRGRRACQGDPGYHRPTG